MIFHSKHSNLETKLEANASPTTTIYDLGNDCSGSGYEYVRAFDWSDLDPHAVDRDLVNPVTEQVRVVLVVCQFRSSKAFDSQNNKSSLSPKVLDSAGRIRRALMRTCHLGNPALGEGLSRSNSGCSGSGSDQPNGMNPDPEQIRWGVWGRGGLRKVT